MPPNLKALVTISVWILFVVGCIGLALGVVLIHRRLESVHLWSFGVFTIMLSVIAAWFRKSIEQVTAPNGFKSRAE